MGESTLTVAKPADLEEAIKAMLQTRLWQLQKPYVVRLYMNANESQRLWQKGLEAGYAQPDARLESLYGVQIAIRSVMPDGYFAIEYSDGTMQFITPGG